MLEIIGGGALFDEAIGEQLGVELEKDVLVDNELEHDNLKGIYHSTEQERFEGRLRFR